MSFAISGYGLYNNYGVSNYNNNYGTNYQSNATVYNNYVTQPIMPTVPTVATMPTVSAYPAVTMPQTQDNSMLQFMMNLTTLLLKKVTQSNQVQPTEEIVEVSDDPAGTTTQTPTIGQEQQPQKCKTGEKVGGFLGQTGGAVGGALAGASYGSAFGPVGTVVGGIGGALIGSGVGKAVGKWVGGMFD